MSTYIALLRSINVGSHNRLRMDILRSYCEELLWQNIQTYIQSGNIVFQSKDTEPKVLADRLDLLLLEKMGKPIHILATELSELAKIFENNPFKIERNISIDHLYLMLLRDVPSPEQVESIPSVLYLPDEFIVSGRAVYLYLPNGVADSKLTNTLFEKKFQTQATARNWKTISKLIQIGNEA